MRFSSYLPAIFANSTPRFLVRSSAFLLDATDA